MLVTMIEKKKNDDSGNGISSFEDSVESVIQESRTKTGGRRKKSGPSTLSKLKQKIEEIEGERDELKELLLRKAAEFDNFRKRTEGDYRSLVASANAEIIAELLPILDDLQRSLDVGKNGGNPDGLLQGLELVSKKFVSVLEQRGVKVIESLGQEFDPEKHEALMQVESTEHPSGTVVEEHLKGYVLGDRVLRHSQVLVSK